MRIINVLELNFTEPLQLISFPIHEEQNSEEVIAEAHKIFGVLVKEFDTDITQLQIDECINDTVFRYGDYSIHLVWSEI